MTTEDASDANADAAWVKRAMIECGKRVILLVDLSKLGVRAVDRICALGDLDDIVADARPGRSLAREVPRAGVSLHLSGERRQRKSGEISLGKE